VKPRLALLATLAPAGLLALSLAACGDLLGLKDLQPYPDGGLDSGEDAPPDGTSGGDTGAPPGDGSGPDAGDAQNGTDSGVERDGPGSTDGPAPDSSPLDSGTVDAPEDTTHPVDAPVDAPVDTSTAPDSSCTSGSQTDSHNCGTCGHDCLLGTCSAGLCQPFTIASGVTAYDMVASSGTLYWVDQVQTTGNVWTCKITGNKCNAQTFASGQNMPERITLGGASNGTVFWSNYGSGSAADGSIASLPLAGGTPTTLTSGLWTPVGIAADTSYVFWAESYAPTPQIVRRPLGSSTTSSLPTGAGSIPTAVTLSAAVVYWSDAESSSTGSVNSSNEGSLSQATLLGSQNQPWSIAVNSTYVYWTDDANPGAVWQYTINGAGAKKQLSSAEINPILIASDNGYAFWIDVGTSTGFNGKVVEWDEATGAATDRATALDQPVALAIDSNAVYFATLDGTLYMMVR